MTKLSRNERHLSRLAVFETIGCPCDMVVETCLTMLKVSVEEVVNFRICYLLLSTM